MKLQIILKCVILEVAKELVSQQFRIKLGKVTVDRSWHAQNKFLSKCFP